MSKEKRETLVTPVGIAKYCWLNKPNTKFDEDGVFSVDLVVPKAEAQALCDKLTKTAEDHKAKEIKEAKTAKDAKAVEGFKLYVPFVMEEDDEGNETGNVVFKLKQKAKLKKKSGEIVSTRVNIFDAKKQPLVGKSIGRGTKMKAAFVPNPMKVAGQKIVGVGTYLQAVQILELVEFKGGGDADSYGFGEEDGYEGSTETQATEGVAETTPAETAAVAGGDF